MEFVLSDISSIRDNLHKTICIVSITKCFPYTIRNKIKKQMPLNTERYFIQEINKYKNESVLTLLNAYTDETEYVNLSELRWGTNNYHMKHYHKTLSLRQTSIYIVNNAFLMIMPKNKLEVTYYELAKNSHSMIFNNFNGNFYLDDITVVNTNCENDFLRMKNLKCADIMFCVLKKQVLNKKIFCLEKYPIPFNKILLFMHRCYSVLSKDVLSIILQFFREIYTLAEYNNI